MTTESVYDRLKAHGINPSKQRMAIMEYLMTHPTHPTVDTIYRAVLERFPTFSRTTIYNSLRALAGAGLIRTLTIEAEEQRFDGTAADHGHFRCSACGEIFDFPLEEEKLAALCPEGYEVQVRDVYLQGRCPACGAPHSCPQ